MPQFGAATFGIMDLVPLQDLDRCFSELRLVHPRQALHASSAPIHGSFTKRRAGPRKKNETFKMITTADASSKTITAQQRHTVKNRYLHLAALHHTRLFSHTDKNMMSVLPEVPTACDHDRLQSAFG